MGHGQDIASLKKVINLSKERNSNKVGKLDALRPPIGLQ